MEELLCILLDCCMGDLLVLENVGYDLEEIAEQLKMEGLQPCLNMVTDEIFWKGQSEKMIWTGFVTIFIHHAGFLIMKIFTRSIWQTKSKLLKIIWGLIFSLL